MGKHTKRKPGRIPKVAVGAAPVALLFAAPSAALAGPLELTQPDLTVPLDRLTLPIDHHQDGRIARDLTSDAEDGASVLRGSLELTRHDAVGKQVGDAHAMSDFSEGLGARYLGRDAVDPRGAQNTSTSEGQAVSQGQKHSLRLGDDVRAVTANEQRLGRSGSHSDGISLGPVSAFDRDEKLLGGGESTRQGLWLPQGVDVLSENSEQVDTGLRRSVAAEGSGRFAGDLGSALAVRRSSGQAIDVGDAAAAGLASQQHGTGQVRGVLDSGSVSGDPGDLANGDYGQAHAFGGHAGPAYALTTTGQGVRLDHHGADDDLADSFSGDLGIENVAALHGDTTTSAHDTLPREPGVKQDQSVSASVLDQKPVGTSWTVSTPPLNVRPN